MEIKGVSGTCLPTLCNDKFLGIRPADATYASDVRELNHLLREYQHRFPHNVASLLRYGPAHFSDCQELVAEISAD